MISPQLQIKKFGKSWLNKTTVPKVVCVSCLPWSSKEGRRTIFTDDRNLLVTLEICLDEKKKEFHCLHRIIRSWCIIDLFSSMSIGTSLTSDSPWHHYRPFPSESPVRRRTFVLSFRLKTKVSVGPFSTGGTNGGEDARPRILDIRNVVVVLV